MTPRARKFGLGRALYYSWHWPRAKIAESIREGGPIGQTRTALGRRAMAAAARDLPPLPPPKPGDSRVCVHVLTGRQLWYQTAFMLHSLARFEPVSVVVHDDGTLRGAPRAALQRLAPFARFVTAAEAEAHLDRVLPRDRYPTLRSRRAELVLFRKLLDVHAGETGWRLFLDSDMLFFRRPEQLLAWLAAPAQSLHLIDAERAYGYELSLLAELAGQAVPDLVNTGVLGLRSDTIDWDRMEHWCHTLIARAGTHYYQEQALIALHLATRPHLALPREDYLVLPEPPEASECRAVLHHYVAGSKRWYFRHNWRRLLPTP